MTDPEARPRLSAALGAPPRLTAMEVVDVHVRYRVYEDRHANLRDVVSGGFKSRRATEVHAVRGVTFDIAVGEVVGIVGSNGSGKSTLMRAMAGVQLVASGSVRARGDVQLLGVGAALKPQLSGYRNIMLGGLAIGMSRDEVANEMHDVIAFSGLGHAIDRPLGTYSSGMRARLAFSIATLRVPDILLIDEALAVGDRGFRRRSVERIGQIQDQAGTVVMVTHNLGEIRATCSRAIWLDGGCIRMDDAAEVVLTAYESSADGS